MLEYRIPAARFLAAAITGVCFFVALIVINLQAAGRRRSFGLLGITMVMASTVLQALNGSLAGAYGSDTVVYGVGSIVVAVLAAAGLVLLALAIIQGRKAKRREGDH